MATKTMIASTMMTDGQIENVVAKLRDALRKHRKEFDSGSVQQVLGVKNLGIELMTPFRKRVEQVSNTITRHVKVGRSLTSRQAIDATGRVKGYINEEVLANMPTDGRKEDDVNVFELDYDPTTDELDQEYEARNLRPDPIATAKLMTDDPAFADDRPLAVQWRDNKGQACYAIFYRWGGERGVRVSRNGNGWYRLCRFAGVRK